MRDLDTIIARLLELDRLRVDLATGHVFSPRSNTPQKPIGTLTRKGYLRACVTVDGRQVHIMLHRVVWIALHGAVPAEHQIDHRDTVKTNNRPDNLEAVPPLINMARAKGGRPLPGKWPLRRHSGQQGSFWSKGRRPCVERVPGGGLMAETSYTSSAFLIALQIVKSKPHLERILGKDILPVVKSALTFAADTERERECGKPPLTLGGDPWPYGGARPMKDESA